MKLFKNEVGRPSNETLRKRRIFYTVVAVLVVVIIGGGSFFIYNKFKSKDIESEGKDASLLKFTEKKSDHYCIDIEAPNFAKYWKTEVLWKTTDETEYKTLFSNNHYNDSQTKQTVCLSLPYGEHSLAEINYRVRVKATTGSNDTVYTKVNPNIWKPFGWKYNSKEGWAYKDYYIPGFPGDTAGEKVCLKNPGYEDWCGFVGSEVLDITEPTTLEYSYPTIVKLRLKLSDYYKSWYDEKEIWPAWYKVTVYNAEDDKVVTTSTCKKIEANKTSTYNMSLVKANETYYAKIKLFGNSSCKGNAFADEQRTSGYRYTK